MRKVIVDEWMTLDGVAQAPMEAGEDTTGGFQYGGWHMPYADEAFQEWVVRNLNEAGGFIFGRRTYEAFAGHWPHATLEEQAVADPLNKQPKYVASRTLSEPLEWQNSKLLHGDLEHAVAALKGEDGGDLHVIGSTNLVQGLFKENLVDELRVIIDPVTVGGGRCLVLLHQPARTQGQEPRPQPSLHPHDWAQQPRRARRRRRSAKPGR